MRRWLGQMMGGTNVAQGNVPPYLRRLAEDITATFTATPKSLGRRHAASETLQSYRSLAERFAALSSPGFDSRRSQRASMAATAGVQTQLGATPKAKLGKEQFVVVCVSSQPGKKGKISSFRTSGSKAFDRLARRAVERSLAARLAPPGAHANQACYQIGVVYGRMPPNLTTPLTTLRSFFHKHVRLLRVTYPPGTRRSASPAPACQAKGSAGSPPAAEGPRRTEASSSVCHPER